MISEETCAVRFGVTRVMLAGLRRDCLVPEVDYVVEGRRVMVTELGVGKLGEMLGIEGGSAGGVTATPGSDKPEMAGSSPAPAILTEVEEVTPPEVVKAHYNGDLSAPEAAEVALVVTSERPPRNRRVIEAQLPEGGPVVRVRVRDNVNFVAGMEIRARPDENYPDVYVLVGRTPRYRGRW